MNGYAISTDGRSTVMVIDWDGRSPQEPGDWSIEFWLRPAVASGTVYAEGPRGQGAPPARVVWIDGEDVWATASVARGAGAAVVARGAAKWADRDWHHLAVSWTRGEPHVSVDRSAVPSVAAVALGAYAGPTGPATGYLLPSDGHGGFVGEVDDVRVWSVARSVQEIALGSGSRVHAGSPGLARYFPITASGGRGAFVADATGLGSALEIASGARWSAVGRTPTAPSPTTVAPRDVPRVDPVKPATTPVTDSTATAVVPAESTAIALAGFSGATPPTGWTLEGGAELAGDGWLRLADGKPGRLGLVRLDRDLPLGAGLTIGFEYRAIPTGGPVADGVVAFLWDPAAGPFTAGYGGGSLGYARYCGAGLAGAIVGVGLDAFGTFASSEPTCDDRPAPRVPNAITVRGPGNGRAGYAPVATSRLRRALGGLGVPPVTVTITASRTGWITVRTRYDDEGAATDEIVRARYVSSGVALPAIVRFGLAGATGGLAATHDVRNVTVGVGAD